MKLIVKIHPLQRNLKPKQMNGMVLVIVLWVMVLITFMVTTMNFQANNSILQAQLTKEKLEAKSLAQAAIYYANTRLLLNSPDYPTNLSGIPLQLDQWGVPIKVSFRGLDGFINPNLANQNLLATLIDNLIKQNGLKGDANQIATAIVEWRENTSTANNIKRRQFFALEELRLIEALNEDIYMAMLPFLSLYAQSSQVNAEYASAELLKVLFPNDLETITNYVNERALAIEKSEPLPQFPINSDLIAKQLTSVTYIAEVNIQTPSGGTYNASTVVLQNSNNGIIFRKWTEGIVGTQIR